MSYIGSKINVTTTSGNKYDGVLTSINAAEATIELQRVKQVSAAGREIKDERIFDFVVFKSDDIKDLYIYENTPQEQVHPSQQPFSDPAIVAQAPPKSEWSLHPAPAAVSIQPTQRTYQSKSSQERNIQFGGVHSSTEPSYSFGSVPEAPLHAAAPISQDAKPIKPLSYAQSLVVNSHNIQSSAAAANTTGAAAAPTFNPGLNASPKKTQKAYSTSTKQTEARPYQPNSFSQGNHQQGHPYQQQGQYQSNSYQNNYRRGPVVPKSDFDFQQMNSAFDKEQVAAEAAPVVGEHGTYYSKVSSFFDNISSDSNVANSNEERRNERSWNLETFGQAYIRGGRGGYRGGSRGGHSNHSHSSHYGHSQHYQPQKYPNESSN